MIGLTGAAKATVGGGALCGSPGGGGLVVALVVGSGLVIIGLGACKYTGAVVLVVDLGGALKISPDVLVGLRAFVVSVGAECSAGACCGSTGECCRVAGVALVGIAGLPGIGVAECCPGGWSVGPVGVALAEAVGCCGVDGW